MPLIECPECKKTVSSEAHACPNCGYPVAEKVASQVAAKPGELLAEIHPSWWGYFWYLFFFWLIIPPIIGALKRSATDLRIYTDRISIERGILNKCYQDYNPSDIRSIDVDQNLFHRLVGIGNITISTAASAEGSEFLKAIPDPKGVRDLILAQRH